MSSAAAYESAEAESQDKLRAGGWQLEGQEELARLELLRVRVKDVEHPKNNDTDLVRHLRARPEGAKVDAAEKLFRKMVAWRVAVKA